MAARYAIYFSPDDSSPLGQYGATILRRTASDPADRPPGNGGYVDDALWQRLTRKPAHYGFHATLKAPFELAESHTVEQLQTALFVFAGKFTSVPMPGLKPRLIDGEWAALSFASHDAQPAEVIEIASACVTGFEEFRAPLSAADIARRNPDRLNDSQRDNLLRYGYPHIFSEFNFHMTLSGDVADQPAFVDWLSAQYQQTITTAPIFDRISLFYQLDRNSPFTRLADYPLGTA